MAGGAREGVDGGHLELPDLLRELKADGSLLLVVGAVGATTSRCACRQMLGDVANRWPLFVFAGGGDDATDGRSGTAAPSTNSDVVRWAAPERSAVPDGSPTRSPRSEQVVEERNPGALLAAISDAIDAIESRSGGLDAAELRVCVDAVRPMLNEFDDTVAFRFLHLLGALVRGADGVGHVHLPVDPDATAVAFLAPLFDAVVELRSVDGQPEQRWRLPESGAATNWLPVHVY